MLYLNSYLNHGQATENLTQALTSKFTKLLQVSTVGILAGWGGGGGGCLYPCP